MKKLREERIGFDNQTGSLERALKAKERDLEELTLMSNEANHAKDHAKLELLEVDKWLAGERVSREKEINLRRDQVRTLRLAGRGFVVSSAPVADVVQRREKVANRNDRVWHGGGINLERGTNPKLARRMCTREYALPSCRGNSAGVAKRPHELISHPKSLNSKRFATFPSLYCSRTRHHSSSNNPCSGQRAC